MKTISLKLPDGLSAKLDRLAKIRKQSKSEVVREAIEHLVSGTRPTKPISALDLAGEVVGCFKGPGDLSTNRKHMGGYGE